MRTNKKVGENASANATRSPISAKYFASKKQGGFWRAFESYLQFFNSRIEFGLIRHVTGHFSIDNFVDEQWPGVRPDIEMADRPMQPIRIIRQDVEQNVRIDKRHFFLVR
jgi:hypothetical protein